MHAHLFRPLLATALCAIGAAAWAQQAVYRCGSNYGQKPCEGAVTVDVEDARTAEQKAAADALTQHNLTRAKEMEQARLAREAQEAHEREALRKAQKQSEKPHKTEKPKSKKKNSKSKKEPLYFTATEQGHTSKKSAHH